MKTIQLEVQDTVYQKIIDFLALLPQDQCHLLVNDAEFAHISRLTEQLKQGDDSEFEDWMDVKVRLL
jgi:hypothetical protein